MLAALAAVCLAATVSAQEWTARVCAVEDLPGVWDVVDMFAAFPMNRADPYYFPHQRYVFESSGAVRHLTSTKPFTPSEFQASLAAPAMSTWTVEQGGRPACSFSTGLRPSVQIAPPSIRPRSSGDPAPRRRAAERES
jgi:hypothetical protein